MLTKEETKTRVLEAIKNNPKGVISALGALHPQVEHNLQMRRFLDSIPAKFKTNFTAPTPDEFIDIRQDQTHKVSLDLSNKKDALLMNAITVAIGTAQWNFTEMLPRLSVQRIGKSEMVYLDGKELVQFFEPELIHGTDKNNTINWIQKFQYLMLPGNNKENDRRKYGEKF